VVEVMYAIFSVPRIAIQRSYQKGIHITMGKEIMATKEQSDHDDLLAKALDMVGLIGYQKGSVVSRTIMNKKSGTVTLFAFDDGQGLSEHTAPFDALVYILDGEAEITISGKAINVKRGEMVIMPANKPHALKALRQYKMLLIMIKS
jgi:quercetin dioxygenase-like cupin family protein